MKNNIKKYTWKPDLPDHRDYEFSKLANERLFAEALPASISLRKWCSKVQDQGQLGSCTSNALAGLMDYNEIREAGGVTKSYRDYSRLFIYYNERVIENTVSQDSGAMLRDGIKSLASSGVCIEKEWPYIIDQFAVEPSNQCYTDAQSHKISSYYRLSTLSDMKTALANGHPFVFGFSVYESFESKEVADTGIVNLPKRSEKMLGGHAVLAIGYDDSTQRFLVRNSWGKGWGLAGVLTGYFTIPYGYLTNRNLSDDLWTVVK